MNTWTELNLEILQDNIRQAREVLDPETQIIFIVKSNAYGHGMLPVARMASRCGVQWFGVAHIEEAQVLRKALPDVGILILGALPATAVSLAAECRVIPILADASHAAALADETEAQGLALSCHAKIDTGMGRLGFAWETAGSTLPPLAARPGLDICGICSHFASAGGPDTAFADTQAERFRKVLEDCEANGLSLHFRHLSNSGAMLTRPNSDLDAVRPGILLYGYADQPNAERSLQLKPFFQWKTRVVQIKSVPADFPISYDSTYRTTAPTHIGILDAGYADGYPRSLSNCGIVLVNNQRCPVVGRVTMNLVTVDLGVDCQVNPGDEAVLVGSQGEAAIWVDELATLGHTISYEILTNIRTPDRRMI